MSNHVDLRKNHTPEKLKAIAQSLYGGKKYAEALDVLNAAVAATKDDDITLFDLRAAVHEKLNDSKSALKDGQHMLRLDKTAGQGYLRTGKILQNIGQRETALKIYERGMKHVPRVDKHYEALRSQYRMLSRTLCPATAVDFFTILPLEVIEMIFNYLSFARVCCCLRISKQWNKLLTTWPPFWREMNLDSGRSVKHVRLSAVFKYITWSRLGIERAVIKGMDLQGNNKFLTELAVKCKKLHTLELRSGGELRQSLRDATSRAHNLRILRLGSKVVVGSDTVHAIMNASVRLEVASFGDVRHSPLADSTWNTSHERPLREFTIFWRDDVHDVSMSELCPPATTLERLQFVGSKKRRTVMALEDQFAKARPALEELIVSDADIKCVQILAGDEEGHMDKFTPPQSLRRLTLYETRCLYTGYLGSSPFRAKFDFSADLPLLSELTIYDGSIVSIKPDSLKQLLECEGHHKPCALTKLDLSLSRFDTADAIALLLNDRLKQIEHLRIYQLTSETDEEIFIGCIANTLKNLVYLAIPGHRKLTGVGVKMLVQSLTRLAELNIDSCPDVGKDAVEWASSQGIRVKHQVT